MSFIYPGGSNTFVPMAQAALQSNFSANPNSFKMNKYVTLANVTQPNGYYIYHDYTEEARIPLANVADKVWADGAYPQVNFSKGQQFIQFNCVRYHEMFTIGDIAQNAAEGLWNVVVDHANTAASGLMTIRTFNVLNALTTTANWAGNTATATSLGGGLWSAGTSAAPYIQKSIQAALVDIQQSTNSTVGPDDLVLVISPTTAYAMAQTEEIRDYFKSSYVAREWMQEGKGSGFLWGLPDPLYGVRVVVEDRVVNTAAHGSTPSFSYILGNNAVLVARPGSLQGPLNTMSTVTLALYQDMNIILEHKNIAQLTEGVVFDNYATIIRPNSGYLITAVTS